MYQSMELLPPADLAMEVDIRAAERYYLALLENNCVLHIAWPMATMRIVGRQLPEVGDDQELRQIQRGLWALLIPHKYAADVAQRAGLPTQGNKRFIDQLAADYFIQAGLSSGSLIIASTRVLALIADIFIRYGYKSLPSFMPWAVNIPISFAAAEIVPLDGIAMGMTLPEAARQVLSALKAGRAYTFGSVRVQPASDHSRTEAGINLILDDTIGCFVHVSGCAGYGHGAYGCVHIPPLSPIAIRQRAYRAGSLRKEDNPLQLDRVADGA